MKELEKTREEINEIDKKMAELFSERMKAVSEIGEYKKQKGLPVFDSEREKELILKNSAYIEKNELVPYYVSMLTDIMSSSKKIQNKIIKKNANVISVDLKDRSYDITVERGLLEKAGELLNLNRKVFILTDSGVPKEYSEKIASFSKDYVIYTVEQGENSKCLANCEKILKKMLEKGFTRTDCLISVGGGVVGDLGGFCASCYMRGIDFFNVPTTVLSQVDSSVGGKTGVDFEGVKNIVGAFWQPKKVLIDIDTLNTLPKRQVVNGLSEALKMAVIFDEKLFELFENGNPFENIEIIIKRSLELKRDVVEKDEKEAGLRKALNFGHTIGHGIESEEELSGLLHGECVALGMIPMCGAKIRQRVVHVLEKLGLPTAVKADINKIKDAIIHDKKAEDGYINTCICNKIGEFEFAKMTVEEILVRAEEVIEK